MSFAWSTCTLDAHKSYFRMPRKCEIMTVRPPNWIQLFIVISYYLNRTNDRSLVYTQILFSSVIQPLWSALWLDEISHEIDEDVHDSSEVSDDSCGGEEQTVGHDLQVELNAHKDHKHILPDLKQRARVWQHLSNHAAARLLMRPLIHLFLIPAVWGHAWPWWRVIQTSWRCRSRWLLQS